MVSRFYDYHHVGGHHILNHIYGLIMKIKIEKKLMGDDIITREELHIDIPKSIVNELNWEDGTVVEWEIQEDGHTEKDGRVVLRNIEGIDIK